MTSIIYLSDEPVGMAGVTPTIFSLDRAGLVGEDGPTHHGSFDIAYFKCIPNMIVSAPMNEEELRNLMFTAQEEKHGPFSIRYPRGKGVMPEWKTDFKSIEIGRGRKLRDGKDIAILSFGHVMLKGPCFSSCAVNIKFLNSSSFIGADTIIFGMHLK
jgi:deoxyxylulose-5-phosphate synthase